MSSEQKQGWEFKLQPGATMEVTEDMKAAFDKFGIVVVRSLMDKEDMGQLLIAAEHKDGVGSHSMKQADANDGSDCRQIEISLWNHPGNDVTGMMARVHKLATTMEKLMGCEEMYHWHSKLIMKHARSGGAHVWHQDYGYWYTSGLLFPNCATVLVGLDKSNHDNGCLEVLVGSHTCGRVEHVNIGGQMGVESTRLKLLRDNLQCVEVPLDPGDAVFTHGNLVHHAPQNHSDTRRWCYAVAYNDKNNPPLHDNFHPQYTPLKKVNDDAIKTCNNFTDLSEKEFYTPALFTF